jgi:hypothetical protein
MPRYLVSRSFEAGELSYDSPERLRAILTANARDQVTWIHSYVSPDRRRTFCLYDASSPEALRHAAAAAGLPVDGITEVSIFDPYFGTSVAAPDR